MLLVNEFCIEIYRNLRSAGNFHGLFHVLDLSLKVEIVLMMRRNKRTIGSASHVEFLVNDLEWYLYEHMI